MSTFQPNSIDDPGAEEHRVALVFVTEAFAEAILAGIDSESFAHAALSAALRELVATHGDERVASFVSKLPERLLAGEYSTSLRH